MARKKRKPGRGRPKRRPPAPRDLPDLPDLPDRRAMEGRMWQFAAGLPGVADPDTPLGQAQEIVYRAFEERDENRRIQLAREALAVCPDCADAYVLLAEHAPSRRQALELYEQGVAAGERALGTDFFEQQVGHFWGILPSRPYMRARLGLAEALWTAGRRDEAVAHLQDMLRLNPNDNQGLRSILAAFLLFLDRDDDLAELLDRYAGEGTATWAYTRALLAFRQQGDTVEARRLLKAARKANKYVPPYLLGEKHPPLEQPTSYTLGGESEALIYIGSFLPGWKNTPGAIAWLRANLQTKKHEGPHAKGPLALVKKWLRDRLPQEDEEWQADFRRMPNWLMGGGQPVRPWTVLVTSRSYDLVLAHQVLEEEPPAALLWDLLVQAMQHPLAGDAHRPTEIQVRPDECWESLRSHLEEVGIALSVQDELDQLEYVYENMVQHVCGPPRPGLLDMPGITPEQVGSFFDAAASYFREAPWKAVGYEAAIKVVSDQTQSGPFYAVIMGQSGMTMGLALYEDLGLLRRMWSGITDEEEDARETVGTSVTYGEEWELPVTDLDAAREYGWPVARDDAYPAIFHKDRGQSLRHPLAWELRLMEALLRAVPPFVRRRRQDDPAEETFTVPTGSGEMKLVLSWVTEEEMA
jgi:tetratricopeptide (TPR) repeat protein